MKRISIEDFKMNIQKYLEDAISEKIIIQVDEKTDLLIQNKAKENSDIFLKRKAARNLFGILPPDFNMEKIMEEKLKS